ncbi:MAG: nucleotidyltransferase domain-containing protein [Myxococcales bacterium]
MTGSVQRPEPSATAQLLWSERYPSASILFCGGSVVRGEGFPSSDLDVVVVFEQIANAWRESFTFRAGPSRFSRTTLGPSPISWPRTARTAARRSLK